MARTLSDNSLRDRFQFRRHGDNYITTAPLVWEAGFKGSGSSIIVPEGFVFQSSVPRLLHWIVSPHHRWWLLAACIHDWCLEAGYPRAFAASEWLTAARAMHDDTDPDPKARLVRAAFLGICAHTVR